MDSITTCHARKPGTLVFGYRIAVLREGYKSITLPTIFSADVPELWHQLRNDQSVITARLYRRRRLIDQYTKAVRA